jgi:hypothetical protein
MPSASVILNWTPGWHRSLDNQSHVLGPAVQQLAGELGGPGPVTDLTIGLGGRRPGPGGGLQHAFVDRLGDRHGDRTGQPSASSREPGHEVVGAAGKVRADQRPPPCRYLFGSWVSLAVSLAYGWLWGGNAKVPS